MKLPNLTDTRWFATAARGTERFLIGELKTFGAEAIEEVPGGVRFEGTPEVALRTCLWSRVASKVMAELGRAELSSEEDVYDAFRSLPLEGWFSPDSSIACSVNSRGVEVKNSHYAALKMKDAIVDYVRDETGRRPDVELEHPDMVVTANIRGPYADFYVELQGQPLNMRGYRRKSVEAPLKESLAAATLLFSGWRGEEPLHDPVCGSGTFLIEAALLATNTAPGLRRKFAFEAFPWFVAVSTDWRRLKREAEDVRKHELEHPIVGTDLDMQAILATKSNARKAGVADLISAERKAIGDVPEGKHRGMFVANPPYGERLLRDDDALAVLDQLDTLAWKTPGCKLCLIVPPEMLKTTVKLKSSRILDTFNGAMPVRMVLYEVFDR